MTRKKMLMLNTTTGITKQIVTLMCGFILPRFMLVYFGSSVNGLVASITNFLSFISLMDLGVGAVIQSNLYKPLADRDYHQISKIIKSSERFFRKLAFIFIIYIIVLCFIFPLMTNGNFSAWYTVSLVLIISISTLAQYLFGMTYQLLLNSDQKSYVQLSIQTITIILNTTFAIILIKLGASIHIVKLMTATVFLLRPFVQMLYVHRHYNVDKTIKLTEEPIQQKWNGFSQHLASVICQNIDIVVLTLFSSLNNVSVYSVYLNVTNGVQQIVMTAATGLEALFGNMIANNENEKLDKTFTTIEWITHTSVTVIFTITAITIVPFITVYTNEIDDANYNVPLFAVLLVVAYGLQCLRIPYFRMIKAAGHFKQTQNGAFISAGLNIVITLSVVFRFGLVGVALGTLVAMLYHTCYFVWYLRNSILKRSVMYFVKYIITDLLVAVVSWLFSYRLEMTSIAYSSWLLLAIKVSGIVVSVCIGTNLLLYRRLIFGMFKLLRK